MDTPNIRAVAARLQGCSDREAIVVACLALETALMRGRGKEKLEALQTALVTVLQQHPDT